MTKNIKQFIETNINNINNEEWDSIIDSCYKNFSDDDFREFANVLKTSGIEFMKLSENSRREFMYDVLDKIFHEILEGMSFYGSSELKKADILLQIDCDLGFTPEELDSIIEYVGVNIYNLEPDFTCFYIT